MDLLASLLSLAESGRTPDILLRAGIRGLLRMRLRELGDDNPEIQFQLTEKFLADMSSRPIAVATDAANEQHYELPPLFFEKVLGPRLKYSSGLWPHPPSHYPTVLEGLKQSEQAMLELTAKRARIENGQRILELGCGWGSLSLYLAEFYPQCSITAVSNSSPQREFITRRAQEKGLSNLTVITADLNHFTPPHSGQSERTAPNESPALQGFDRILAIEVLEHMDNLQLLLSRIASWLAPTGLFFTHFFCHRSAPYQFETEGAANWMGRYFFTGGCMPTALVFSRLQKELTLVSQWAVSGHHYENTLNAWLKLMDERDDEVQPIMNDFYGVQEGRIWKQRWRIFFMACAELFGYRKGTEWFVCHSLFAPHALLAHRSSQ